MKRFKKVYIEITNICNLSCSFCSLSNRKNAEMGVASFEHIIKQIKPYTDYIYFHVKGEPLLHSELDGILEICDRENIRVNITTNGTLLKEKFNVLNSHSSLRQINVSLHSENDFNNYFEDVFEVCRLLSNKTYISYRLWTLIDGNLDEKSTGIVNKIISEYSLSTEIVDKLKNDKQIKIDINTYVNKDNLFEWPYLNNDSYSEGYCYGLSNQIAILVDGTVVPCCLDSEGIINLGNIFIDEFAGIINSDRVNNIIEGFRNNKCSEELCRKCSFKNRF